jgi:hypothetical protein
MADGFAAIDEPLPSAQDKLVDAEERTVAGRSVLVQRVRLAGSVPGRYAEVDPTGAVRVADPGLGDAGDNPPTLAGSGALGYLRAILDRLVGGLARAWTLSATTDSVSVSGTVAVGGPVAVANLPATQPVSDGGGSLTVDGEVGIAGAVTVANFPADQAVTGVVAVSNLPGTQAVSGTVAVANLPATQPVSDGGGSLTVDGEVGIAGPVTVGASALPTGAATEATAGTIASSVLRRTDPLAAGTNLIGHVAGALDKKVDEGKARLAGARVSVALGAVASVQIENPADSPVTLHVARLLLAADVAGDVEFVVDATSTGATREAANPNHAFESSPTRAVVRAGANALSSGTALSAVLRLAANAPSALDMPVVLPPGHRFAARYTAATAAAFYGTVLWWED